MAEGLHVTNAMATSGRSGLLPRNRASSLWSAPTSTAGALIDLDGGHVDTVERCHQERPQKIIGQQVLMCGCPQWSPAQQDRRDTVAIDGAAGAVSLSLIHI